MTTSEQSAQSPVERRSADAALATLVDKVAPEHAALIVSARKLLRKRLPTAHEIVYEYTSWIVISFSPNAKGYAGVLAIRASADGVKLYFNNGKGLPDPDKLLQGSAKLVRWVAIESTRTLTKPAVAALIEAALARNTVPFAAQGTGPLVIQSK